MSQVAPPFSLTSTLLLLLLCLGRAAPADPPAGAMKVAHQPRTPHSRHAARVTAAGEAPARGKEPVLECQVLEPGKYVEKDDPAFAKGWTPFPLAPDAGGEAGALPAEVPASFQKNRRLIRYRVVDGETGARLAPAPDDSVPDFAWFVYDGVPAWRGAIDPRGRGEERTAVSFGAPVMGSVQAYHLIARRE